MKMLQCQIKVVKPLDYRSLKCIAHKSYVMLALKVLVRKLRLS
jgi:hypothetical protein